MSVLKDEIKYARESYRRDEQVCVYVCVCVCARAFVCACVLVSACVCVQ